MWYPKELKLFIDITTKCNVGCPMCHRTNPNGCGTADWLPDIDWSLEQFKQAYPENVCKVTREFNICGTWGDPIVNKDLLEIVRYIRTSNSDAKIIINTNGSLRNEEFWWELGKVGGKNLSVIFAVEGLDQKMHERYRQKSFLKKVLNNMDVLSNTPATIITQTIAFKHNEQYLKEIEQLCRDHGSIHHYIIETNRFLKGPVFNFVNAKGEPDTLEQPFIDFKKYEDTENEKESIRVVEIDHVDKTKHNSTKLKTSIRTSNRKKENLNVPREELDITCVWAQRNRIVINPDGQVLPCCYLCNSHYNNKEGGPNYDVKFAENELMKKYKDKEFNVFNKNLLDIIAQPWFKKELKDSFTSGKPLKQCVTYCSKNKHSQKYGVEVD